LDFFFHNPRCVDFTWILIVFQMDIGLFNRNWLVAACGSPSNYASYSSELNGTGILFSFPY
jgi:hypothetical protein